jgi:hypothetical protein
VLGIVLKNGGEAEFEQVSTPEGSLHIFLSIEDRGLLLPSACL